ncbi:MAG: 16S rRNA (guanine(966)-N(2))-methyltransferase RsmD [SAR324 cluster bacterium]|nr:16S rRNA (guanine(966)-N(2))-methyltransferase RsmD [SAR324 cluster bacterium]
MPRITAGSLKNRKIICPEGLEVRPSLEKTRAMIFNSLNSRFDLADFRVVDLFAGSGALGFEAISWGVKDCTFVEKNQNHFNNLQKNVKALEVENQARLLHQDGLTWLKKASLSPESTLFLLDPPYGLGLAEQALDLIAEQNPTDVVVVVERGKSEELNFSESYWDHFKSKKFGKSLIDFYMTLKQTHMT